MGCIRPVPVAPATPFPNDRNDIEEQNPPPYRRGTDPGCKSRYITPAIIVSLSVAIPLLGISYLIALGFGNVFHYAQFQVDFISFSVPSNSRLPKAAAEWDVQVSVRNPGKHHRVSFREVEVSVWHNATEFLTAAAVDDFSESPEAEMKFRAHSKGRLENSTAAAIDNARKDGVILFDLRVAASATYPIKFTLRKHHVRYDVVCGGLKVGLVSPTAADWKMAGGARQCSVKTK